MTVEYFLTTLVVVATPGAGVLYTLAAGVSRGWRASVVAAFAWMRRSFAASYLLLAGRLATQSR